MIVKAMPSLRKCMAVNGYNFEEDSKENRFQFIIAVGGEIFDVDQELSISKSADGVYAAGSGASYALGALYAGADAYQAMEIASKLTAFTAGPYISKEQPRKIK
jgi:ATP-dependent protease HslVU (ClpYQ) peptidase subunit